jgi:alkylated DNA repair protein alkB family protein 1
LGLWTAAQQGLQLQHAPAVQQQQTPQQQQPALHDKHSQHAAATDAHPPREAAAAGLWGVGGSGPTAVSLLRRLRWATLGPPYDWTQRVYLRDVPHMPLPPLLHQLASMLAGFAAQHAQHSGQQQGDAANPPPPFCPDAALVNYYYLGGVGSAVLCECCGGYL